MHFIYDNKINNLFNFLIISIQIKYIIKESKYYIYFFQRIIIVNMYSQIKLKFRPY